MKNAKRKNSLSKIMNFSIILLINLITLVDISQPN